MSRRLSQSNIPEWDCLMKASRADRQRGTAPVTVISSAYIPRGGLIVMRGSKFMYYKEDPSRGFYIRSIFGNNLAFVLSHFMQHDTTTEISTQTSKGDYHIVTITGSKNGGWQFQTGIADFNWIWDRFLNAVVKIQRLVKRVLLRRMVQLKRINHNLFKYKKASAFMSSELARWMQVDVTHLILREFIDSHGLKKDFPVCRIETDSFKKIRGGSCIK